MEQKLRQEMMENSREHWWFVAKSRILKHICKSFTLPADAEILEIGCGSGQNLLWLKQFGALTAVETSADLREHVRSLQIADVFSGALPAGLPGEVTRKKYDLICMFDVLEHIEADKETLHVLKSLIKPDGRLFITVPAHPWLWSAHDVAHHHHRRYSRKALERLLIETGYRLEYIGYYNCFLFPLAVLLRLMERLRGVKNAGGTEVPAKPVNILFREIFAAERFLLPKFRLPFGVSLIAIAKI